MLLLKHNITKIKRFYVIHYRRALEYLDRFLFRLECYLYSIRRKFKKDNADLNFVLNRIREQTKKDNKFVNTRVTVPENIVLYIRNDNYIEIYEKSDAPLWTHWYLTIEMSEIAEQSVFWKNSAIHAGLNIDQIKLIEKYIKNIIFT